MTAGNAGGISDGAAAVVVTTRARCREAGVAPLGRIASWGVAGVDPDIMGIGPVPASRQALHRAGLEVKDLDLAEINEAFSAQYLAVERELGLDRDEVERQWRRSGARPSGRGVGNAARADRAPRAQTAPGEIRARGAVHRRRTGHRHGVRGTLRIVGERRDGHHHRRRDRVRPHGGRHRTGVCAGRISDHRRGSQPGAARQGPRQHPQEPGGARRQGPDGGAREGRDARPAQGRDRTRRAQGLRPGDRGHHREPGAQERDVRQARQDLSAARAPGVQHVVVQHHGDGGGDRPRRTSARACTSSTRCR